MMSFSVFKVDRNFTLWPNNGCKVNLQFLLVGPQAILLNHLHNFYRLVTMLVTSRSQKQFTFVAIR